MAARKWNEIYDSMIAEKNTYANLSTLLPTLDSSQTLLDNLTTTSKVAGWRVLFFIVAVAQATLENLWDSFKAAILLLLANQKVGTVPWYKKSVLEYQHGDPLVLVGDVYVYNPVNPANRIITQCAVIDSSPLVIKVAKTSSSVLAPLNLTEIAGFTAYMQKIKWAGTILNIISFPPDELALNLKIYYDPLVLAANGSLISAPSVFPVNDAIQSYLNSIEFNNDFINTKLVDQLQATTGVVEPIMQSGSARIGTNPFVAFTERYSSIAGYMKLYNPLVTITYVPSV